MSRRIQAECTILTPHADGRVETLVSPKDARKAMANMTLPVPTMVDDAEAEAVVWPRVQTENASGRLH